MRRASTLKFTGGLAFSFCCFFSFGQAIPSIKAKNNAATIRLEGKNKIIQWGISPEIKPDIYTVPCQKGKSTQVTFITDLDSLTCKVAAGESFRFMIILNDRDTAYTQLEGKIIPDAARFSKKYIRSNTGKVSIGVPEVKELLQVIFAITPTGLADTKSMIINHDTTAYYLKVIAHFLQYKDQPIVKLMDSLLQQGQYIHLKMDASAFYFKGEDIVAGRTYHRYNNSGNEVNLVEPYIDLAEKFAKASGFRKFYAANKGFYDSLIHVYQQGVPVKRMWDWCEKEFPSRYQSYHIYFSPLVKGNHSTSHGSNDGFKETNMFIRPALALPQLSEMTREAINSRIVFTEIDHNYVNPETDRHLEKVNRIFDKRAIWANGKESDGYRDPYSLFNEYMTWALYILYCREHYAAKDFQYIRENTVNYLVNIRGFPRFNLFTNELLRLFNEKLSGETVASLYPSLLQWCGTQN